VRPVLLLLAALVAFVALARAVYVWMASDETRIRWVIERMEEGFDAGSANGATSGLAPGWRHEGQVHERRMVHDGLLRVFWEERDPKTKELLLRVEVPEESLAIRVDGERAELEAQARFERRRGGEWQPQWTIAIEAELALGEDGWEIVRSRHRDVEGRDLGG
jgi:hypothetical protein